MLLGCIFLVFLGYYDLERSPEVFPLASFYSLFPPLSLCPSRLMGKEDFLGEDCGLSRPVRPQLVG